jgi:hypothetical protein
LSLLVLWWCSLVSAVAADAAATSITISKFEDIAPLLPPPGASKWDPAPLVAGIGASTFTFTPKHYYALVDRGNVHPDVVKAVAAKAAVFYDPSAKPLPTQAQTARQSAPASTVPLNQGNFVELFEFFNDVKNDLAAAESSAGSTAPQSASESINAYERRVRTRDEKLVALKGPIEGKVDKTTFVVDLPASVVEQGGCKRSVSSVTLDELSFDLFRTAMGTVAPTARVSVGGSTNIETAQFSIEGSRRFEVIGRCGTTGTKLHLSMSRTWDGKWTGQGGF